MGRRTVLAGAGASLALTALSLTTVSLAAPGRHSPPQAAVARHGMMAGAVRCEPPRFLPGQRVTAFAVDMGAMGASGALGGGMGPAGRMALRSDTASVTAGTVSLVLVNRGMRTHELVVLPLADAQAVGSRVPGADGTVNEAGSLGEASADCAAGTGQGVEPGGAGWVTLTLPRGRYELACNLLDHYAAGMVVGLVVL